MFDLGKIECTTALEVELLAALVYERRLRSRREQPPKPEPLKPPTRLTFLAPPQERRRNDFSWPAYDATAKEIQAAVARRFRFTVNDILSYRRNSALCLARHAAVVLCHELTLFSYPQLARVFGRDHTTMLNSVEKFRDVQLELAAELHKSDPLSAWASAVHEKMMRENSKPRLSQTHESVA